MLTQKNCKKKDLEKVLSYFPKSNIVLKFFENYPEDIKIKEGKINKQNLILIDRIAKKNKWKSWFRNKFVSRLWYRRYLCNQIRLDYEMKNNVKYEAVIRTRFDVGILDEKKYSLDYNNLPIFSPDIMTIGKPELINLESQFDWYPFTPKFFYNYLSKLDNKKFKKYKEKTDLIIQEWFLNNKWLYGSEVNPMLYLNYNTNGKKPLSTNTAPFRIIVSDKKGGYKSKY